jgi:hypothetical protein
MKKDDFYLVTKEPCLFRGTNNVHHVDDYDHMNGMRVKHIWTLSTVGTSAPLFITVSRLNGREMPTGCDMLVVEVPGLCIGQCGGRVTKAFKSDFLKVLNLNLMKKNSLFSLQTYMRWQ